MIDTETDTPTFPPVTPRPLLLSRSSWRAWQEAELKKSTNPVMPLGPKALSLKSNSSNRAPDFMIPLHKFFCHLRSDGIQMSSLLLQVPLDISFSCRSSDAKTILLVKLTFRHTPIHTLLSLIHPSILFYPSSTHPSIFFNLSSTHPSILFNPSSIHPLQLPTHPSILPQQTRASGISDLRRPVNKSLHKALCGEEGNSSSGSCIVCHFKYIQQKIECIQYNFGCTPINLFCCIISSL